MNHTEFIDKLEELSHIIQGTSVTTWDLFFSSSKLIHDDDFYVSNRGFSCTGSINDDELYCNG